MKQTLSRPWEWGLLLAVLVIFLLLAANFQSMKLAFVVLSTIPGGRLRRDFHAAGDANHPERGSRLWEPCMAIGVAVANAILFDHFRRGAPPRGEHVQCRCDSRSANPHETHLDDEYGHDRRMIPMALGIGEGAQQTAPLGRAVIGGLLLATAATLLVRLWCFPWFRTSGSEIAITRS